MVDAESSTKRCPRCDTFKSRDCFGKAHQRPDGLQCWCRECKSKDNKDRWKRDPEVRARTRARDQAARAADPQKYKEYAAAYMKANRKKYTAYVVQWYKDRPEIRRDVQRKSYAKHREKRLESAKKWRSQNRLKCAAFCKNYRTKYPEKMAALSRAYKARRYGAAGKHTKADVDRILLGQRWKCAYCRKSVRNGFHVDHIMPLKSGGSNEPKNLQITCATCNIKKHSKHPIKFAQSLGLLV